MDSKININHWSLYQKNKSTQIDLLGSEDMCLADQMLETHFDKLGSSQTVYTYKHKDTSDAKGLPIQQNSMTCGVYSLWY